MKHTILFISLVLIILSCRQDNEEHAYAVNKADNFVENYANEFLTDTNLLRYSWDFRNQFRHLNDSLSEYEAHFIDSELILICLSDSCKLTEPFNSSDLMLSKGRYKIDSLGYVFKYSDSTIHSKFNLNPVEYFTRSEHYLLELGVVAFKQSVDKSSMEVYFTDDYYLIWTRRIGELLESEQIVKSYPNNWYLVKKARPVTLGQRK
ncbi:MAG: hypothetical protein ACI8ZN_002299 [Bacteroidia bacterium]|jgi:hypothetical protein